MLEENNFVEGNIQVYGTISYASQEPWLFPSSIKDNILFGQRFDRCRYQKVVKVCALEYDYSLLEFGDETLVTDRGINLSKGQQARINLARAVYKDSDIYLLDDSLTALDVRVQNFIFKECILKFLSGKICILVTQNISHMLMVERVITLEKGRMVLPQNPVDATRKSERLTDNAVNCMSCVTGPSRLEASKSVTEDQVENKVYRETKKIGKVDLTVYKKYFGFGGGIIVFCGIMLIYVLAQFFENYSDQLLTDWCVCFLLHAFILRLQLLFLFSGWIFSKKL